jgi:antirestriction protein ArdC
VNPLGTTIPKSSPLCVSFFLKNDNRAVFSAASHASKAVDFLHNLQPKPAE